MKSLTASVFLPLDARPVCYQTPQLLMKMAGVLPLMPNADWLGNLKQTAAIPVLIKWLETLSDFNAPVIVALDLIAYGGLIPSRIGLETEEEIRNQLSQFYGVIMSSAVYGYSSVLRIPTYNSAEEEPDYWASYGSALQAFSTLSYQAMAEKSLLPAWPDEIPLEVLADFLHRRHRNFSVNEYHIQCLMAGLLQSVIFCEDDRTAAGLNVAESECLKTQIALHGLETLSSVQTGADEIGHCLLARHLNAFAVETPTVWVVYTHPEGAESYACFDGLPLAAVVQQRLNSCGLKPAESYETASMVLLVHCPSTQLGMGDYCENRKPVLESATQYATATAEIDKAKAHNKPLVIADVASANGGDLGLYESVLLPKNNWIDWLYGYAGWNTPGNSIGSALAMASIRFQAEAEEGAFNVTYFQQLLAIRLADDVIYQSKVRAELRKLPEADALSAKLVNELLACDLEVIKSKVGLPLQTFDAYFPCNRTFEIGFAIH
ncbi:MAG: DUF4127 family protein [Vampirovibrio sp.]|nr:DUF4127 family protein [Vampirovibrio sp.]